MSAAPAKKPSMMDLLAKARVMGRRYWVILKKFWWVPAVTSGLGFSYSLWKGINMPPSFVSSAQMVMSGHFQIEGTARLTESTDYLGTQFALMLSDQVAQRARTKIHAQHPDWQPVTVALDINQTPHTSFIVVRASGIEPLYTQAYLDAVMQEYIALKKEMRTEKSDNITSAIRNELILLEKETDADQHELLDFQKVNNIGFLQTQGNGAGEFLVSLERELATLKTELNLLNTLTLDQNIDRAQQLAVQAQANAVAAVQGNNTGAQQNVDHSMRTLDPTFANSYGPMMEYQQARGVVLQLRSKKEVLLKTWTPDHPGIKQIEEDIKEAERRMENFKQQSVDVLNMRKDSINVRIQNLQNQIREWGAKAMDLGQKLAEYERIKMKLDNDKKHYDQLITAISGVEVSKNVEQDSLNIFENAEPAVLTKANLFKLLLGGFATGLLAGLAILFGIDKTNDKISATVECTGNFKEFSILGQIPHEDFQGDLALLVPYDPRRALLEAFRALRSSIIFAPLEGTRPKAFMIASAVPGEGKTTIASNLAVTLAFSGAKTLLVDCNLSNGRLHEIFDTLPDNGLANVLQQEIPWTEAVVQTNIDNLFLLPRGEALTYPAEHFFGAFLKEIYPEFDYIIFDTASVLDDVDALSFAPIVDGILFVVRFHQTSAGKAKSAIDHLNARQVNILGLICNDVV